MMVVLLSTCYGLSLHRLLHTVHTYVLRAGLHSARHAAHRARTSTRRGRGSLAGEHTEGNARGAQPYAHLRWQEPWGTAERARCPRPTAKVPNEY